MKLVVLIPTHDKSIDEIKRLFHFLKINSDVVFANQSKNNQTIEFVENGHLVTVINSDTVGVSKNRNILLDHVPKYGDIFLCIDDDCVLCDHYEDIVTSFFEKYKPEYVLFNGLVPYEGNRKVHSKKTKKVRNFFDISYAGGPGFAFSQNSVHKHDFRYNERVGYPNYIFAGEDTLMYLSIVRSRCIFYRSSDVIFSVEIDKEDNSAYFKGFNDQFFITKGAIYRLAFPNLYWFISRYYAFKLSKQTNIKYKKIKLLMKKGFRYVQANIH